MIGTIKEPVSACGEENRKLTRRKKIGSLIDLKFASLIPIKACHHELLGLAAIEGEEDIVYIYVKANKKWQEFGML